jgi:hypothetical protein
MVTIAARISNGSLASELSKASAAPWKRVMRLSGRPATASPSDSY